MLVAFVIWSVCTIIFVIIGCSCRKSQEAVGFFTFVAAPKVRDVKNYNRLVSLLWFVVAILYEAIGVPLLFMEQNSVLVVPLIFAVVILFIMMMVVYLRIESKYRIT